MCNYCTILCENIPPLGGSDTNLCHYGTNLLHYDANLCHNGATHGSFYPRRWHIFTQPLGYFHTAVGIFYPKHWNAFKHLVPHISTNYYSIRPTPKSTQSCTNMQNPSKIFPQLITHNSKPLFQKYYPATSRL